MKGLDRVPVVEVEYIKFFFLFGLVKLIHHRITHGITVLYDIAALRLAVMVIDIIDCLVRNPSPGEKMYFMLLCQCLGKTGRCTGQSSDTLGVERFPAEECYLK